MQNYKLLSKYGNRFLFVMGSGYGSGEVKHCVVVMNFEAEGFGRNFMIVKDEFYYHALVCIYNAIG